ncbi:MAG: putative flagellar hook-length control protein FliK [Gammaproteobacteria bacterium]|nr:MAG: putative flagellar hook-length control protein FliK [Gammaproteobacteria bacterium]TND06729.1 MAG: putative flagellar hook-length control protein FliK [Gammaproteobacteria bacterium]
MSQDIPSVLPANVTAAANPAALTATPQNQPVGAQNIFANLLVAQFKERGLMPGGTQTLNLDQLVQPGQALPQGGKALPDSLPVGDDLMQMLEAANSADSLPSKRVGTDDAKIAGNMLDVALRTAIGVTLADKPAAPAAPVATLADTDIDIRLPAVPMVRDNALVSNNLLAQLNDTALLNQMTSANKPGAPLAAVVPFDQLPELLAQRLATKLNGAPAITSAIGGQHTGNMFTQLTGASQAMSSPIPAQSVFVPVDHADWGHELGDRVRWLVTQNVQTADIRLNPPELGPVRVHISIDQGQVSVTFTSHHAQVRDALQSAMANLGDLLAESGLNLAEGNVADQSPGQQNGAENEPIEEFGAAAGDDGSTLAGVWRGEGMVRAMAGRGLIDHYV